ncbi:hypothetical protein ACFOLJ_28125 [Rugamonas sp. CCM 8940]|uniref:hypothetical protein n=1 Tax=Rugamonas sp. CCM 8940 TaxID=2765359 RepID=UPI0018F2812E|nr:hypothetical protein [Rugamonas sp. CCM 8940]MBJ7312860.1 hypothetical protein [Rugamonas sp. CCM 8940]
MKKFLFADLDDTLFQSLEKCGARDDLQAAAVLKDGVACSFSTAGQRALFDFMQDGMTVIPATARNLDAFRRVRLDFHSYAVINYGGVVLLPDGSADRAWLERMRPLMLAAQDGLAELAGLVDAHVAAAGQRGRARVIEDFSIPFYLVFKDADKIAARLEPIEREVVLPWLEARGHDYFIHRNGNNLAVLPNALNKSHAVAYVTELLRGEHGALLTFGMGDSRSDARFMAACDYAIVPRGSQLARLALEPL